MNTMRRHVLQAIGALGAAVALAPAALGQVPAAYPATYGDIVSAAGKEGKVVIYSATDSKLVAPLVEDFHKLYPGVKIEYHDMNTTETYNRVISESAAGVSADVVWTSAMDLQMKLVNDGYAMAYASPEIKNLPSWAVWRNEAFGTTFEPIGIVYNKRLVDASEVPQTRAELVKLVDARRDKFKGKVTTFDPEKSGLGFLLATQDANVSSGAFWNLAKAMGASGVRVQSSSGTMLERIASGENLIGYNLLGSYAMTRAKKDASIGVVLPKDHTLVVSRVMFITKKAAHPNAAKLWTDYLLSKRGQELLATKAELFAINSEVLGDATATALIKQMGAAIKPIPVSADLLAYLEPTKRLGFLKQWQAAVKDVK